MFYSYASSVLEITTILDLILIPCIKPVKPINDDKDKNRVMKNFCMHLLLTSESGRMQLSNNTLNLNLTKMHVVQGHIFENRGIFFFSNDHSIVPTVNVQNVKL